MAIGIEIALDPSNVVNGANQVDKALDGIGTSADSVQKKTDTMGDAMLAALTKQQKATQQMLANAQATKNVAQEQSRLLASQSSLNSSSAQSEARQKEYQRLSTQIKQAVQQEAQAKKELSAINKLLAGQKLPEPQSYTRTEQAVNGIATAGKALLALGLASKLAEWGTAFVNVADNINLLQSRISLYTKSQQETNAVFAQLQTISNSAGVSLEDTAGTFAKFAAAGKDMGVSNDQVLKLIGNLQTMARVSGASTQEASAAIYQLSQSFASGRLQGDEFRSVSEQLPVVLDTLAKKLGVTRAELRQMATDGKLNSDTLLMLAGDFAELDAQAAKLPRTVDQASQSLMNNLAAAADALNDKLGVTGGLAKAIDSVSIALGDLVKRSEGTYTEVDRLNAVVRDAEGDLKMYQRRLEFIPADTVWGKSIQKNIDDTKAKIASANVELQAYSTLMKSVGNFAANIGKITAAPVAKKDDAQAQKTIDSLKQQLQYTDALKNGNYELAASIKLGTDATEKQVSSYAVLLKQQTAVKNEKTASAKASREATTEANREEKQLERNQAANQKYIKTLTDKTAAGTYDVQRAQEMVAQSLRQGQSVDELSASYLKSIQVQNQLTLTSQQTEAQSRLNKDATLAEKQAVDQYVASLYQQQQAKQLAAQVSQISTDTTAELNPVQGQMDQIAQQEAQRLAVLEQARQQDLLNEQQYQQLKTQVQQSGEQQRNDLLTQNNAMLLGATSDLFGGLADTLKQSQGEQSGIYKAMFAASKAFAIAQASVLLWQNVSKAMAVGFPQNIPFIAAAFAQGTSILGSLSSIAATGFATGGYITGAGTGTSDSIPARLSAGEYVMPAQQTRQYRNELAAMRAGTYSGQGQSGGMKVEVANYGNDNVTTQQLDESRVRLIIGEEVPRVNAAEFNNPYSATNKAYRSNYNAERKV